MLPEIVKVLTPDELVNNLGHQHLPPVRGTGDPRCAVNTHPYVPFFADERLACVNPHANLH